MKGVGMNHIIARWCYDFINIWIQKLTAASVISNKSCNVYSNSCKIIITLIVVRLSLDSLYFLIFQMLMLTNQIALYWTYR